VAKVLTIFLGLCVGLVALAFIVPQSRFLLIGFPEERLQGRHASHENSRHQTHFKSIEKSLLAAGLNANPVLGDTGTSGHMARLIATEVTAKTLEEYANGLVALNRATSALGQTIPASFWDVDTTQLQQGGWTSYRIVAALNTPEGAPFVTAIGLAYSRFHRFKTQPLNGTDTALDTALDLFAPVVDLIEAVGPNNLLERSTYITSAEQAALYLWQDIVAGSTRRNPLTHQKIFDHGFATRFHVTTIWQYETGKAQNSSEIWGVTGFDPEFVGPPENNNQVEHLSISMVIQGLLREPVLVLNAFEEYEKLTGSVSTQETNADKALNAAVHDVFVPTFESDLAASIESLRLRLK
jgi:hypothetical protein